MTPNPANYNLSDYFTAQTQYARTQSQSQYGGGVVNNDPVQWLRMTPVTISATSMKGTDNSKQRASIPSVHISATINIGEDKLAIKRPEQKNNTLSQSHYSGAFSEFRSKTATAMGTKRIMPAKSHQMLNQAQEMSSTFLSNLPQTQLNDNIDDESLETIHDGAGSNYEAYVDPGINGLYPNSRTQIKSLSKAKSNPKHFYSTFKNVPITSLLKMHTEGHSRRNIDSFIGIRQ